MKGKTITFLTTNENSVRHNEHCLASLSSTHLSSFFWRIANSNESFFCHNSCLSLKKKRYTTIHPTVSSCSGFTFVMIMGFGNGREVVNRRLLWPQVRQSFKSLSLKIYYEKHAYMFFYKHNVYKHTETWICLKNKHTISILLSLLLRCVSGKISVFKFSNRWKRIQA